MLNFKIGVSRQQGNSTDHVSFGTFLSLFERVTTFFFWPDLAFYPLVSFLFMLGKFNVVMYCSFLTVSSFTKGEQMVPVMNQFGIHCAVFGNHDFGEWWFNFLLERWWAIIVIATHGGLYVSVALCDYFIDFLWGVSCCRKVCCYPLPDKHS